MEVRDVFQMRKEGRVEEAYAAIRPMYAQHQGRYTTLCMFWVAHDVMQLRLDGRVDEAYKIFKSLCRLYPKLDDADHQMLRALLGDAVSLSRVSSAFSMTGFLSWVKFGELPATFWQRGEGEARKYPSLAERLLSRAYNELRATPTVDNALRFLPLFQVMMQRLPRSRNTQLYQAKLYNIMGEHDKATEIYNRLKIKRSAPPRH